MCIRDRDSVQMEVFQIEKNIRGLLVVATVRPLVGVLGTIQGLVGFYSCLLYTSRCV